ncbi:hypothetical protein M422DRAFT_179625 [Sphaerobolus stellatus SS14]|uniref:Allantoate permease n=1 Tax=Sphaerobolus stellatus (strain SS14) TaxID=990650 RepID=A0A0C9U0F1_SPHS4|nr:hypothetical protein M422DRAFT_179625 [Sphaerobolus stellatus SS14]
MAHATPRAASVSTDSIGKDKAYFGSTGVHSLPGDLATAEKPPNLIDYLFRRHRLKTFDLDAVATEASVYDDPVLAPHYQPRPDFENAHRFDPSARWTYREERDLVRKIDWRVMLWAAVSFTALNLDRSNISQANTDNFLPDLGLSTNDFNLGNTIFKIGFLCAELPSQLVSKRLGPGRWVPSQMCLWSIVTAAQFFLSGKTSFLVCRALIGYYYKKTELPLRLSYFWASLQICSILASFIAFGVLHMRGVLGKAGWRWLFLIEGIFTLLLGIATFFMMPPGPCQTKAWWRPNGWFTEREEIILVNRILRDDPTKGDMHNREGLNIKRLFKAACDYDLYPIYILGLMFGIPPGPPGSYLTLSLRNLGFTTFQTNLLTIPSTLASVFTIVGITIVSELVDSRAFVAMAEDVWALPCLIAIYCLPKNPNQWAYFVRTNVYYFRQTHPIQVAWCSRNAGGVAGRTVNASLYNMFVQASAIIYSQIYRKDDAPQYVRGNRVLISICVFNCVVLYPGTRFYYKWRNEYRDKKWNAMTSTEKDHYLRTTTDVGNRKLDFRFAY